MTLAPHHDQFDAARGERAGTPLEWKRPMDMCLALLALVGLLPVFLIAGLLIAATSRGGVFYVQTRVGEDGRRFGMIKFRSMYQGADRARAELLKMSDRDGLTFKMKNDPRITPVGRLIRRLSIDELPQLINVLRGEMSLVGPRPALPQEVNAYPVAALERLNAKPGITGVWQISGRADVSFEQMVDMDIAYVRNVSVWTDLSILWSTVWVVLSGRGAY